MRAKLSFRHTCVGVERNNESTLHNAIQDQREITRKTFLRHVNQRDMLALEDQLGYIRRHDRRGGLKMAHDYHVTYARSHWGKRLCYLFTNSATEYFFY